MFTALSCASRSFCVAATENEDGEGDVTSGDALIFNGYGWTDDQVDDNAGLESVSCPTTRFCAALGDEGAEYVYRGYRWSGTNLTDDAAALSCASASSCETIGLHGSTERYDGRRWSYGADVGSGGQLEAVSCASSTMCMAVDDNGHALRYDGAGWSRVTIDHGTPLTSVSCPTARFCAAATGQSVGKGRYLLYDGRGWGRPLTIPQGNDFVVSCASSSFCGFADMNSDLAAVSGNLFADRASGWGGEVNTQDDQFGSISCPSVGFCEAAGDAAQPWTYSGGMWINALVEGHTVETPAWVSCTSSSFCAGTDGDADVETFGHGTWSRPQAIGGEAALGPISCATSSFCVAVDGAGNEFTYHGRSWSRAVAIDPGGDGLVAIACPAASFCVALDYRGRALIWRR
jgi:hypothetical protein